MFGLVSRPRNWTETKPGPSLVWNRWRRCSLRCREWDLAWFISSVLAFSRHLSRLWANTMLGMHSERHVKSQLLSISLISSRLLASVPHLLWMPSRVNIKQLPCLTLSGSWILQWPFRMNITNGQCHLRCESFERYCYGLTSMDTFLGRSTNS